MLGGRARREVSTQVTILLGVVFLGGGNHWRRLEGEKRRKEGERENEGRRDRRRRG
jgi:hypothetical protein